MHNPNLIARASAFHPWDAMAPAALSAILRHGPFRNSVETGCGGSTIVLSHASEHHIAFAIEGDDHTISELRRQTDFRNANVIFVEGQTKDTLPGYRFDDAVDFVLLDGPHAYPLAQIEFAYLFPQLRVGGWLVLDDIQIPSVHELFRFLRKEPYLVLEEIALRTAFFRRIGTFEGGPDGWASQGINAHAIFRYAWKDRLRHWLGRA
ncbi:MAG: class I SAM-dependent methyltransferase [Bryobacteraceae bacterium]